MRVSSHKRLRCIFRVGVSSLLFLSVSAGGWGAGGGGEGPAPAPQERSPPPSGGCPRLLGAGAPARTPPAPLGLAAVEAAALRGYFALFFAPRLSQSVINK